MATKQEALSQKKSRLMNRNYLIVLLLAVMVIAFGNPLGVLAYQDDVDWMWNNTKPSARGGCKNFIVKAGPPKIIRGRVSGRNCLVNAINAFRKGDHEKAFGWILAGQCHNSQARLILVQNAPLVLEYLLKQYGDSALTK